MKFDFDFIDEYYKMIKEIGEQKEVFLIGFNRRDFKQYKRESLWNSDWLQEFSLNKKILFLNN